MYAAHVVVVVMVVAVAAHHVSSTPDSCRTSTINRGRTAGSSSVGSRACGHGRALKAASRQPAHPEQAACGTAARGGCVLLAGYCCVSRIQGVHTCGLHCSSIRLMVVVSMVRFCRTFYSRLYPVYLEQPSFSCFCLSLRASSCSSSPSRSGTRSCTE